MINAQDEYKRVAANMERRIAHLERLLLVVLVLLQPGDIDGARRVIIRELRSVSQDMSDALRILEPDAG